MRKTISFLLLVSILLFAVSSTAQNKDVMVPQIQLLLGEKTDCNGDMNGTAYLDNCSICVGGNTGQTACTQDCNGDWGGIAYTNSCGCVGGNTGVDETVTCVTSAGQIWIDRNLGANRVATSLTDSEAYGDLYQWGRLSDGHEKRNSATNSTLASSDVPGHGDYILSPSIPLDWRDPQNDDLWQGASGINNPCPAGFRLPTAAEWQTEMASWGSQDSAGAFSSPLKLVTAGFRVDGIITATDLNGYYWSSTVYGTDSKHVLFHSGAVIVISMRGAGASVRCIKD